MAQPTRHKIYRPGKTKRDHQSGAWARRLVNRDNRSFKGTASKKK